MKTVPACTILILGLLAPMIIEIHTATAAYTPDGTGFPLASGINITSPTNTTYLSGRLTLNISIRSIPGPIIYNFDIVYSLDGEVNVTLPVTSTFVPVEATAKYANGTTAKVISNFASYYLISGCAALPEPTQGSHNLTVYARHERKNNVNTNWPALLLDKNTVEFTINNGSPPETSSLILENETFTQTSLPLNSMTDVQKETTESVAGLFTITLVAVGAALMVKRKRKTNRLKVEN